MLKITFLIIKPEIRAMEYNKSVIFRVGNGSSESYVRGGLRIKISRNICHGLKRALAGTWHFLDARSHYLTILKNKEKSTKTTKTKTTETKTTKPPAATTTSSSSGCAAKWGQCGGASFNGATCCQAGSSCKKSNEWYVSVF